MTEQRKLDPIDVDLAVHLTNDELLDFGERLGQAHAKLEDLDRQLDEAKAANKSARKPVEADVNHLAASLRTKTETRPVRCQWVLDYASNLATLIRLDTGQVVRERAMTERERQTTLLPAGGEAGE